MQKAIFLDRDGIINRETGDYIHRIANFLLNDEVIEALQLFQSTGYLLIVITNQSGIAKGLYTHQDVVTIHQHLTALLAEKNIHLTAIYYCPHHPSISKCLCRKPDSLLVEKAIARFFIDPSLSYFIGDADRDVEAGMKAGMKAIKLKSNTSLLQAMKIINIANC